MSKEDLGASQATGLSQADPQEGLGPSGFDPSRGGRVVIGPDDPLYVALQQSRECVERLEQMEREQAAAWARVRHMPLGGGQ